MGGWQGLDPMMPELNIMSHIATRLNSGKAMLALCGVLIVACCMSLSSIAYLSMTNPVHGLVALGVWCIGASVYCSGRLLVQPPKPNSHYSD